MHGVSPQSFVEGATIEMVRYGGTEIDAPVIDRRPATGTLPDQLEAAYAWLRRHITHQPRPTTGATTPYGPQYPEKALLELARNMVQHRTYEGTRAPCRIEWYDDRIEFSNPGNPFGAASEGTFGEHADYRNPLITKLLVDGGYVEKLGRGVRLVRKYLADAGLPELLVEVNGYTRVTVRAAS